jgi:glycosyltransferase involved in cell wall biosynthesis
MKRITILHLRKSEGFYGAERIILSLAEQCNNVDMKSIIGSFYDHRYPVRKLYDAARNRNIPSVLIPCRYRFDIKSIFIIRKLIRKNHIHIIHCHGFKADVFGWFVSKIMKIPVIATKHGWTHANTLIRIWENIDLLFLRGFDSIISVTDLIQKKLIESKIPQTKIRTIPNGIAIPKSFQPNPKIYIELGIRNHELVVAIVGRLSIEKGHQFFLKAVYEILKQVPYTKFLIVGEGPLKKELEDLTRRLKLKNQVCFTGFRNDVEEILKCTDVVVSTSLREGVPLTLLEAMAFQRPIVATAVGGVTNLIKHGVNGYLTKPGEFQTFISYVIKLLKDQKLRKRFGAESQKIIHDIFSEEKMVAEYKRIYHAVHRDTFTTYKS